MEKKADSVLKEKKRLEGELEALTKKTHDASGQLVLISQELLKKERSVCRAGCVCVCVCAQSAVTTTGPSWKALTSCCCCFQEPE